MKRAAIGRAPAPFLGARPFLARDRHLFHGRGEETEALVGSWAGHRLTVLHGDNGVGKTSLVSAGAVPALTDRGSTVLPSGALCFDPGFPEAVLPGHNPYTRALLAVWSPSEFPTHGPGTSVTDFLRTHESTDRHGLPRPIFAVLDQTELLLRRSAVPEQWRKDFLDELFTALEERLDLRLLLTVRTEHLDDLRRLVDKREVEHAEVALAPLTPGTATSVVTRSLARFGRRAFPEDPHRLVEQVRTVQDPGGGPRAHRGAVDPALLQFLGLTLWEAAEQGAPLVPDSDTEVDRALTARLAGVLEEVAAEHLVPPDVPHAWLRRVVLAGERGVGSPACEDPDSALTPGLVHALEDRHLVTVNRDGSAYVSRHPRLERPLMALSPSPYAGRGPSPWGGRDRLAIARAARTRGEAALAAEHTRQALRAQPPPEPRVRALLTALLGDLAFERGEYRAAAEHYAEAARSQEAVGDGAAVSRLLVAEARNRLLSGERAAGLAGVAAAEGRVHGDPSLRAGIGQVLWLAGQAQSALDVLEGALVGGGGITEARRTRGEIRSEQDNRTGRGRG